ncbi:MAG TPA: hypothetical protein QF469_19150 [Sphingomonas sanguinis]|uniref:hypothetical protein n=1 Tax=Sphingomonas sanguinis TaxID=33051 RepID=UPI002AC04BBB|nr:hypothetical protein [Sphingomonas sanguinis]
MTPVFTTPAEITSFIRATAKAIGKHEPVYVDLAKHDGMPPSMCFENVAKLVRTQGGKLITGWLFWEWPGVMIDAEHHAIWERPDGLWEDVTPKADGETRILFVRDDKATYKDSKSILNKRFPAQGNKLAKEFIALKREAEMVFEPYRRTGDFGVPEDALERRQKKDERARRRWNRLLEQYGGGNVTPDSKEQD